METLSGEVGSNQYNNIVSSTECDTLTASIVIYHVPDFLMLGCILCPQVRDILGIGNFVYYNVCVSLYS